MTSCDFYNAENFDCCVTEWMSVNYYWGTIMEPRFLSVMPHFHYHHYESSYAPSLQLLKRDICSVSSLRVPMIREDMDMVRTFSHCRYHANVANTPCLRLIQHIWSEAVTLGLGSVWTVKASVCRI